MIVRLSSRRDRCRRRPNSGVALRFEKLETLLRVALDMRGSAEGLSLDDIHRDHGVSRRTAERMRDAIERVFPQMEQANPGEVPKRWRIRAGVHRQHDRIFRRGIRGARDGRHRPRCAVTIFRRLCGSAWTRLAAKLKSLIRPRGSPSRLAGPRSASTEAEGIALRPGPRQNGLPPDLLRRPASRHHRLSQDRLHYRARGTGPLAGSWSAPTAFSTATGTISSPTIPKRPRAATTGCSASPTSRKPRSLDDGLPAAQGFFVAEICRAFVRRVPGGAVRRGLAASRPRPRRTRGIPVSPDARCLEDRARRLTARSLPRRRRAGNVLALVHVGGRGRGHQAQALAFASP